MNYPLHPEALRSHRCEYCGRELHNPVDSYCSEKCEREMEAAKQDMELANLITADAKSADDIARYVRDMVQTQSRLFNERTH